MLAPVGIVEEQRRRGQRAEERHHPELDADGLVQRGDVAEPHEHRRLLPWTCGAQRRPVDQVEHPLHAVAAAGTQHGGHAGVAPGPLEVARPLGVPAREVALPATVEHVLADLDLEPPALQHVGSGLEPVRVDRAGRGDDAHDVALFQAPRSLQLQQGHELSPGSHTAPVSSAGAGAARPAHGAVQDGAVSYRSRQPAPALDDVMRRCAEAPGPVSVWVGRPGGTAVLELDARRRHFAASTMKLAVLVAAHVAGEEGRLDLDRLVRVHDDFASSLDGSPFTVPQADDSDDEVWDAWGTEVPIRWLVRRMVVRSSNLATNHVLEQVGVAAAARVLADAGCRDSVLQRGIEDHPARRAGLTFEFTAADLATLMGALVLQRLAGRHATAEMLATLRAQERIEDVRSGLPAGVQVAHKNGWVDGVRHSVAYVEPESGRGYVQAVLTSTGRPDDEACRLVAEVTAAVWADRAALLS